MSTRPCAIARTVVGAEGPSALPDQRLHDVPAQLHRTDRRAGRIAHVQRLQHGGQAGGLRECGHRPAAVTHVQLARAGAGPDLARPQVVAPDAVVARHRQEHLVVVDHQGLRLVQRDIARRHHHAFGGLARASVAAQRVHRAGGQVDAAQGVVAGVGDVQRLAHQRQPLGPTERGVVQFAVGQVRRTHAELADHPALMVALQHTVMAGVGHEQAIRRGHQSRGEAQGHPRLRVGLAKGTQVVVRRRMQAVAQTGDLPLQLGQAFRAHRAMTHVAFAIDQQDGGPGVNAKTLPGHPVGIVRQWQHIAVSPEPLQRGLRLALAVEARDVDGQRLQAAQVTRLQHGQVVEPLRTPGRSAIDERQGDDAPALLVQRGRGRVQPLQAARQFRSQGHVRHLP